MDPVGTVAQPENDRTPSGSLCFVTGQGSVGGVADAADVDFGRTTLRSPVLDLSADPAAEIGYWRWLSNDTGVNPGQDVLTVDVSGDGGQSWTNVEVVGPSSPQTSGGWFFHSFRVADFVNPAGSVVLRFVAQDTGGDSIVEAAIDDLTIVAACCDASPDCDDGLACTSESCNLVAGICATIVAPGFCSIDGACRSDGAPNPLNACEQCDATSPTSWTSAEPAEVASVVVQQAPDTQLSWAGQAPAAAYDVVGGAVSDLRTDGGASGAGCLTDDLAATLWTDPRPDPPADGAYYYLVRSQNTCGDGGYGSATSGAPRLPALACP